MKLELPRYECYDVFIDIQVMKFLLPVLIVISLFSFTGSVSAQGAGIKLIPTTIEKAANPGDVLNESLTITNVNSEEKEYFIYKRNIKGVGDGGVPLFSRDESEVTGYELIDWVSYQDEPVKIPANGELTLPIIISIPQNATPGSHFGGIFVSAEPPKFRENGAGVGYEVASILTIRIAGEVVDNARIRSFSTGKLFYSEKNVEFNAKIENQGNILIRPHGPLEIHNMFGGKPQVLVVNDVLAGVFPGTARDLTFSWQDEGLGFGKYEAILALSYDGDGGQRTIDSSLVFWVFPLKIMIPIAVGFVSMCIIGYVLTKFYIHQALMKAAGGRRIPLQRARRNVGLSRFMFVFVVLLVLIVVLLIATLVLFA